MRGYRGIFHEFTHTGSWRALALQLRTGIVHVARQLAGRRDDGDPLARFFDNYGPDGVRPASPVDRMLRLDAQACLVCGLCSVACAAAGGEPRLDPRDAVVAASRLHIEWRRLGLEGTAGSACAGCAACDAACPQGIPIHEVQEALAAGPGKG
ncbi:MAG: hypothetical protein CL910_04030 [Deltaproteobacteria bacterium]|jgi:succinate dehydrogenase/fumarate reductase-like Fe-S protein|nr:hypothetical protein [Deltaproteobacteria bacterium]